jgi:hypothetical protein
MALQKNIKEVESTEAGFVANAAAKNDGFLTDVIGYPMIKKRGNDYDYWFPEKSRDELGTYTYYDKTVKDLTALNDCIVQRRLSSYGDADTYLDLSTDDQVVLNVGGVPFLTVVESDSAAIGTLGGNLALGANYLNYDGEANQGVRFTRENQLVVYNAGETDTFIQVANDVTGSEAGDGLIVGVEADGDAVLRVDYMRYLKFQRESLTGPIDMATLSDTGTIRFNVNGKIQCEDMTALNDCIVQRRLSSYGDADTYFDFSTDDQTVLNVGGVLWLSVVETGGAAVGTLGGNLALGANTISRDGSAGKGFGVSESGILTGTATAETFGDTRSVLRLYDDTALGIGDGAGINLYGKTKEGSGTYANLGGIKVSKENGISGDISSSFYIQTRKQGSDPANALRLDSSQNGYIRNKLMVGSLDKTPANQLVVYNAGETDAFIQVTNDVTGTGAGDGLIVGVEAAYGDAVLRVGGYGKYLKFQVAGFEDITTIATLRYTSGTSPEFRVNGEIHCDSFWIWQEPIAGAITPDRYIIIKCNGNNYKIPVVAV